MTRVVLALAAILGWAAYHHLSSRRRQPACSTAGSGRFPVPYRRRGRRHRPGPRGFGTRLVRLLRLPRRTAARGDPPRGLGSGRRAPTSGPSPLAVGRALAPLLLLPEAARGFPDTPATSPPFPRIPFLDENPGRLLPPALELRLPAAAASPDPTGSALPGAVHRGADPRRRPSPGSRSRRPRQAYRSSGPHTPSTSRGLRRRPAGPSRARSSTTCFPNSGSSDYVVWFYTPMALPLLDRLSPRAVVYDCMDELSAFAGAPPQLREREAQLMKRADLVLTGGPSLYEARKRPASPRALPAEQRRRGALLRSQDGPATKTWFSGPANSRATSASRASATSASSTSGWTSTCSPASPTPIRPGASSWSGRS